MSVVVVVIYFMCGPLWAPRSSYARDCNTSVNQALVFLCLFCVIVIKRMPWIVANGER